MLNKFISFAVFCLSVAFCNGMEGDQLPEYHNQLIARITQINASVGALLKDDFNSEARYNVIDFPDELRLARDTIERFGDEDGCRKGMMRHDIELLRNRVGYISRELLPNIDRLKNVSDTDKLQCKNLIIATMNAAINQANQYIDFINAELRH